LVDLRLHDLATFLIVRRTGSVSAAAREAKVTPSQVSKTITRLETQLGVSLFGRSTRGLVLSPAGHELAPTIEQLVEGARMLGRPLETRMPPLTFAAPQYLLAHILPKVAACQPRRRMRFLELAPAVMRAYAAQDVFDVALLPSAAKRITTPWVGTRVGEIRSALYTTPASARRLGPGPVDPKRLREIPMVSPVADHRGLFATVDDDCPIDSANRTIGCEAQTIMTALKLATLTGQLVFGPTIAAQEFVASGALVEVDVLGWDVREPLFVACNQDRVVTSVRTAILDAVTEALREHASPREA
jgi:DNA-binding transcriptional LysR family regulator